MTDLQFVITAAAFLYLVMARQVFVTNLQDFSLLGEKACWTFAFFFFSVGSFFGVFESLFWHRLSAAVLLFGSHVFFMAVATAALGERYLAAATLLRVASRMKLAIFAGLGLLRPDLAGVFVTADFVLSLFLYRSSPVVTVAIMFAALGAAAAFFVPHLLSPEFEKNPGLIAFLCLPQFALIALAVTRRLSNYSPIMNDKG